jgi:chorismate mutase
MVRKDRPQGSFMNLKYRLACGQLILLLAAATSRAVAGSDMDPLVSLVDLARQRNALADDVALSKYRSGKQVQDTEREQVVIDDVRREAPSHGLGSDEAARFFAAQIDSSKFLQYALLWDWRVQGHAVPPGEPDLEVLRRQLNDLQAPLLSQLAEAIHYPSLRPCSERVAEAVDTVAHRSLQNDELHQLALQQSFADFCHEASLR